MASSGPVADITGTYPSVACSVADAIGATVAEADGGLALVEQAALAEFAAPADDRFAFLVDTLIAGIRAPGFNED